MCFISSVIPLLCYLSVWVCDWLQVCLVNCWCLSVSVRLSREADWFRPPSQQSWVRLLPVHCGLSALHSRLLASQFLRFEMNSFKNGCRILLQPVALGSWLEARLAFMLRRGSPPGAGRNTWNTASEVAPDSHHPLSFSSWTIRKQRYYNTLSDCRRLSALRPAKLRKKLMRVKLYACSLLRFLPQCTKTKSHSPLHSLWLAVGHHWSLSDNCTETYFIHKAIPGRLPIYLCLLLWVITTPPSCCFFTDLGYFTWIFSRLYAAQGCTMPLGYS